LSLYELLWPTRAAPSSSRRQIRGSSSAPADAREGLVHPGTILHIGNWALRHNVVLGPWMHVGSTVQHFSAARIGDELTVRAVVTANYERKGHRFVELDVLVYAEQKTATARIGHIAIYRPRQLAKAA
jgi:hypothetical protein